MCHDGHHLFSPRPPKYTLLHDDAILILRALLRFSGGAGAISIALYDRIRGHRPSHVPTEALRRTFVAKLRSLRIHSRCPTNSPNQYSNSKSWDAKTHALLLTGRRPDADFVKVADGVQG